MFQGFASLPTELKLKIVRKCQAIPYVRLRQSCRYMNEFCEDHHRHIGIYIYRKIPELFLLNSMKETFPFYKQIKENEEDIDVSYAVVEYGRLYGEANLKMALNRENLLKFKEAISGFNFPEVSILNYNEPQDEEGNKEFNEAFDCFMEVLADLHVDTLNIKGLTREQYETVTSKLDVSYLRLRKDKINRELLETNLAKNIRHFSCTFPVPPEGVDFQTLLKSKSIATIDWGSQDDSFDWSCFEQILQDYENQLQEMYFYRFYFEDGPDFYKIDLTSKEGPLLPSKAFHIGSLQIKEIPNAMVDCPNNQELKYDYWLSEIGTNRWMMITVSRKSWSFCTDVCVLFDTIAGKEELNMSFISILIDDLLLNGSAIDYSDFYEKLEAADTLEEKEQEMLDYLEYIPSLYLE